MPQLSLIVITGYVWRGRKTLTPTPGEASPAPPLTALDWLRAGDTHPAGPQVTTSP